MLHNVTALNSCGVVSDMSLFFKVNHQRDCLKQNEWVLGTREARVHLTLERDDLGPEIFFWTQLTALRPRPSGSIPVSHRIPPLIHEMTLAGSSNFSPSKLKIYAMFRWNTWIIELEYCDWSSSLTLRAQFDEHESGVDPGSNFSATLLKLYFILYFGKQWYKTLYFQKGAFLMQFC